MQWYRRSVDDPCFHVPVCMCVLQKEGQKFMRQVTYTRPPGFVDPFARPVEVKVPISHVYICVCVDLLNSAD